MPKCTACGSSLETIEYQARSADEATRVTTTCPKCPIDASRITLRRSSASYARGLPGPVRAPRRPSTKQQFLKVRSIWRVKVDLTTSLPDVSVETKHITCPMPVNRSKSIGSADELFDSIRYQITGPTKGYCESISRITTMGFGATLESVLLYEVTGLQQHTTKVCEGRYGTVEQSEDVFKYIYVDEVSNKTTVIVQSEKLLDTTSAAHIVASLYGTMCIPKGLRAYMQQRDIAQYSNLSPRAWDVSAPPKTGYKFTSKPDGERMWIVLYGAFWYACSTQKNRQILKWWHNPKMIAVSSKPMVYDAEYVMGYGFIFIDCLTDTQAQPSLVNRDLSYALSTIHNVEDVHYGSPLIIREYFDTNDEAQKYSDAQRYPTDGTLGIADGRTETIKIKSVKGIDLLLSPGGALVTNDGDTVAVVSEYPRPYEGKVVEVRFTAKANEQNITILDMFPRTNKVSANSTEAAMNIFRSCVHSDSNTDNERTAVLKWCNSLCRIIIERALETDNTKHVVLDVGTGSGQSLDRLRGDDSVSFIHMEPNEQRAAAISRRARARLLVDVTELGPIIMSLKTRKLKRVVVNCKLQDLLDNKLLCERVMPEVKCVIATFSAQFVIHELETLVSQYRARVFGCMYTYDEAVDGVLVNGCGASMTMSNDDTATIRWGSEQQYTEPVTYQAEYHGLGTIVRATDIQDLRSDCDMEAPAQVCKHIRVIL